MEIGAREIETFMAETRKQQTETAGQIEELWTVLRRVTQASEALEKRFESRMEQIFLLLQDHQEGTESIISSSFQLTGTLEQEPSSDPSMEIQDPWSIKTDYGSNLNDEQKHVDTSDMFSTGIFRVASVSPDVEVKPSMLGLQSYWYATSTDELTHLAKAVAPECETNWYGEHKILMIVVADGYSGKLECAWKVFDEMSARGFASWDSLLTRLVNEAFEILEQMQMQGVRNNQFQGITYSSRIKVKMKVKVVNNVASQKGRLIVCNAFTCQKTHAIKLPYARDMTYDFSLNDQSIASDSLDSMYTIFNLNSSIDKDGTLPMSGMLSGHKGYLLCIQYVADDTHLITSSHDQLCVLWGVTTRQGFGSDTDEDTYRMFDIRTGHQLQVYYQQQGDNEVYIVTSLAFSISGKLLIVCYSNGDCYAWDTLVAKVVLKLGSLQSSHEGRVTYMDRSARISSYITLMDLFYNRNHGPVLIIDDIERYCFSIDGIVGNPKKISMSDIWKLPKYEVADTLQCAGNRKTAMYKKKTVKGVGWGVSTIGKAIWEEAKLAEILELVGIPKLTATTTSGGKHIEFISVDNCKEENGGPYKISIPLNQATNPHAEVLLAYEMNGETVNRDHGYPLRLIVPGVISLHSIKKLASIKITDGECQGFFMQMDSEIFPPSVNRNNNDWSTRQPQIDFPHQSVICLLERFGVLVPSKEQENGLKTLVTLSSSVVFSGCAPRDAYLYTTFVGGSWNKAYLKEEVRSDSLTWERWTSFNENKYFEEVERYSKPGSVAKKKAYVEAHYKKKVAALLEQANDTANDGYHNGSVKDSESFESDSHVANDIREARHCFVEFGIKLSARFYGPFQILARIGAVAYRLSLPQNSKVHPVFHVSQLKRKLGAHTLAAPVLPVVDHLGSFHTEPVAILARRLIPRHNRVVTQVLVQWSNSSPTDATWEDWTHLHASFPHFNP